MINKKNSKSSFYFSIKLSVIGLFIFCLINVMQQHYLFLGFYGLLTGKWYTTSTFFFLGLGILFLQFIVRSQWLPRFYESWFITLIPFFMKNGILTGSIIDEQVVWYNDKQNLGFRLGTIPFEDVFYGMLLILCTIYFYERFESKRLLKGLSNKNEH